MYKIMEESRSSVRVNIYGDEYPVKGEADERYICKLADYVDRKMREIAQKAQPRDKLRVAVLAALNIAGELFECRGAAGSDSIRRLEEIRTKTEELTRKVETSLKG